MRRKIKLNRKMINLRRNQRIKKKRKKLRLKLKKKRKKLKFRPKKDKRNMKKLPTKKGTNGG